MIFRLGPNSGLSDSISERLIQQEDQLSQSDRAMLRVKNFAKLLNVVQGH